MQHPTAVFPAIEPSIIRLTIHPPEGKKSVGTAFMVRSGIALTCAHVVLGVTDIRPLAERLAPEGGDAEIDACIRSYANDCAAWITATNNAGQSFAIESIEFDWRYDIAVVHLKDAPSPLSVDMRPIPLGQELYFCGYGYTIQTENVDWPLSIVAGMAMSRAPVMIGGYERRPFLFVQAASFGGHSGSPLIERMTDTCVGMVNGFMQWGADGLNFTNAQTKEMYVDELYVPQGVTYATAFADIMNNCPLLRKVIG